MVPLIPFRIGGDVRLLLLLGMLLLLGGGGAAALEHLFEELELGGCGDGDGGEGPEEEEREVHRVRLEVRNGAGENGVKWPQYFGGILAEGIEDHVIENRDSEFLRQG